MQGLWDHLASTWTVKHGVCSCPALPATLHPIPHSWSICKAVSSLCVCLSVPGGMVVGLSGVTNLAMTAVAGRGGNARGGGLPHRGLCT